MFEKLGKEIKSQIGSMKNNVLRANKRFTGIITESSAIKTKLRELSDKIDYVEQVAKEYANTKFEEANVRIEESRLLNGSGEISEQTHIQFKETIAGIDS